VIFMELKISEVFISVRCRGECLVQRKNKKTKNKKKAATICAKSALAA